MSHNKPLRTDSFGSGHKVIDHPTRSEPEVYKKQTRALGLIKRLLWVARYWPSGRDIGAAAARDLAFKHLPFLLSHAKEIRPEWVSAADIRKGIQDLCGSTNLWKYQPPYAWVSMQPDTRQEVRAALLILKRGRIVKLEEVDVLVNAQPNGIL